MTARLIYAVGPSGAGKDSVLTWLMSQSALQGRVHWAVRDVTRVGHDSSQRDRSVSPQTFAELSAQGAYALSWQANGLSYGIRHEALAPLTQGHCVLLNGARRGAEKAAACFPGLTVLHITADPQVLRQRLMQRGREQGSVLAARLAQASEAERSWTAPAGCRLLQVHNNTALDEAGQQALGLLAQVPGWPARPSEALDT